MKKFLLCFILALFISAGLFAEWDIGMLLLASDGAEHDEIGKTPKRSIKRFLYS